MLITSPEGKLFAIITVFALLCIPKNKEGLENKQRISSCAELKSKHRCGGLVDQMNMLYFGENPFDFSQWLNLATGTDEPAVY